MKLKMIRVFAFALTFLLLFTNFIPQSSIAATQKQTSIKNAKVERLADGKLKISWQLTGKSDRVKIYWSTSPEKVKQHGTILKTVTEGNSITIADPKPGTRSYFALKSRGDTITVAERLVPLQGTVNFRDLGGYETTDGRHVKWGHLYRADELVHLTTADQQYLQNSGLKTIVDFRTDFEVEQNPNPVIEGVKNLRLTISDDQTAQLINAIIAGDFESLGEPGELLIEANKVYATDPAYPQLVQQVLEQKNLALVQHCTSGKDRTGFGSAILLLLLGVPEETVMEDYLLSNQYRAAHNQQTMEQLEPLFKTEKDREVMASLLEVKREYLQSAFDEIEAKYGTFDRYAKEFLGVSKQERKQLQKMLLEK